MSHIQVWWGTGNDWETADGKKENAADCYGQPAAFSALRAGSYFAGCIAGDTGGVLLNP